MSVREHKNRCYDCVEAETSKMDQMEWTKKKNIKQTADQTNDDETGVRNENEWR